MAGLGSSSSEMDLDRLNIEEYLTVESIRESPRKLHLYVFLVSFFRIFTSYNSWWNPNCILFRRDLLDISPTLKEAAGAIVDVSSPFSICIDII